jgi:hypothetical protein
MKAGSRGGRSVHRALRQEGSQELAGSCQPWEAHLRAVAPHFEQLGEVVKLAVDVAACTRTGGDRQHTNRAQVVTGSTGGDSEHRLRHTRRAGKGAAAHTTATRCRAICAPLSGRMPAGAA